MRREFVEVEGEFSEGSGVMISEVDAGIAHEVDTCFEEESV